MITGKYSPNWLLEKLKICKSDTHRLMLIMEFQDNLKIEISKSVCDNCNVENLLNPKTVCTECLNRI